MCETVGSHWPDIYNVTPDVSSIRKVDVVSGNVCLFTMTYSLRPLRYSVHTIAMGVSLFRLSPFLVLARGHTRLDVFTRV